MRRLVPIISFHLVLLVLGQSNVAASNDEPISLDGISVLISTAANDETNALPILASDVELIVHLLLINTHGSNWNTIPIDSAMRFKTRKMAVLVRILAHVAQTVGEEIDVSKRDAIISRLMERAGGPRAFRAVLKRTGTKRADLKYWISNFLLAKVQLQYLIERTEPPTDKALAQQFQKGGHPYEDKSFEEVRTQYREMIVNKQTLVSIEMWLSSVLERGEIRFSK